MNIRVTLHKDIVENFGLGRQHTSTIEYSVNCDVEHVSTVAKVAAEKGYQLVYVGVADYMEDH